MKRIKLIVYFALLGFIIEPAVVFSMPPPLAYQGKKIEELLPLLESSSAETRKNATAGISWQLEQNQIALTNIERSVIEATLMKVSSLVKHEDNRIVRLGCIAVLLNLDAWTNTVEAIIETTDDKDDLVKVRAITALIYVSKKHSEPIPSLAISRLDKCLKSSSDSEILWQAALAAGESGERKLLPSLQALLQNSTEKVRKYASEAIGKINH